MVDTMITSGRNSYYMLVLGMLMVHLPLIFLPSVNQEFAFADAAQYFISHEQVLLDQYFAYQANTLGIPWLAGQVSSIFSAMDTLTVLRLMSLSGIVLLAAGFLRISLYTGELASASLLGILLLNPLVWTYSGRGTADFLPAAVGIFAISLALGEDRKLSRILTSGILLGIASVLKYHELSMSLILFALLWSKNQARWACITTLAVTAIALVVTGFYLVKVRTLFGFWVTPERFQHVLGLNLSNFTSNFIAYAGYLVMLTAPFSLFFPEGRRLLLRHWKFLLPLAMILILAGAYWIKDNGEMNLGPLDRWVSKSAVSGIFLLLSLACVIPLVDHASERANKDSYRKALGLAVLVILLVFSVSRPAQRYLLPILPIFLLALPRSVFRLPVVVPFMFIAFAVVDAFISYSQWCTGTAAERMTVAIERAGHISLTDPGAIEHHVGNRFRHADRSNVRFVVVQGRERGAIITVESGFSFARKSFSLVPTNLSHQPVGR